jgi:hypothetical protein
MKEAKLLTATQEELDALLAQAKPTFSAEQYQLLEGVLGTFFYVMQALQNARTSLKRLSHMLFGKRTESTANVLKLIGTGTNGASDHAERPTEPTPDDSSAPSAGVGKTPKKHKGHGRNGATAYPGAQVFDIPVPGLKSGDACPNCLVGKVYDTPPKILVKVVGNPPLTASILRCACLRCRLCEYTVRAPLPLGMSTVKYEPSCATVLALLHYGSGMPYHRLDRLQSSMQMPMPKSTQWDQLDRMASAGPRLVYEAMIVQAAQGRLLHNDDTTARILDLMGARRAKAEAAGKALPTMKAINTTGIVSLLGDVKVILFFTGAAHSGMNMEKVLAHRAQGLPVPMQMCDALAANTKGDFLSFLALCLAHSRRQFVDVAENFPDACRDIIEVFASVYRIDQEAKDMGMSDLDRLQHHRTHSRPLMLALKKWMRKQLADHEVEPNCGLGKAMRYMLKHWMGLTLFYRKAGAPLDNNIAERILKKAIIYRKNSLFYRTQHGADVGDILMSVIFTCESCKTNAFDYLQALQIHGAEVAAHPHRWLPWNHGAALGAITHPPPAHVEAPAYVGSSARVTPPPAICARQAAPSPG